MAPLLISADSRCLVIRDSMIAYLPELAIGTAPVVLGNLWVAYLIILLLSSLYRGSIKRDFSL